MVPSNNSSPLVSIIIPAYNSEQWIEEAINSCLNQSYKNIEVIIVNDGSTDCTLSVVQQINDSRLKVFSQMNMGACVARNRGFDESRGEYIKFFDADDYMYPNAIEQQMAEAVKHDNNTIIYSGCKINDCDYTPSIMMYDSDEKPTSLNMQFMTPLFLFTRKVLSATNGFNVSIEYFQDTEIIFHCMSLGYKLYYTECCVYNWNLGKNPECITSKRKNTCKPYLEIFHCYKKYFQLNDKRYRNYWISFICQMFNEMESSTLFLNDGLHTMHQLPFTGVISSVKWRGSRSCGIVLYLLSAINNKMAFTCTEKCYVLLSKIFKITH